MRKEHLVVFGLIVSFLVFVIFNFNFDNIEKLNVEDVILPNKIKLENDNVFIISNLENFDTEYSRKNETLAKKFNLTEDEAFILGYLGKYWAQGLLDSRAVEYYEHDLVFNKQSYVEKFKNSPFCIENDKFTNQKAFERMIKSIRRSKFVIVDMDTDDVYSLTKENSLKVKNFSVVRKKHSKKISYFGVQKHFQKYNHVNTVFVKGNIKILLSDETTKIKPDKNCSHEICKEILHNINSAKNSIDMAIYGYSEIPEITRAVKNAASRGVKVRIVYDIDSKNENIYPETFDFVKLFSESKNDKCSEEVNRTMHNKFYIFDNQIVVTGSANLSFTDMSGFNSNAVIVINSKEIAKIYEDEFNQMFSGKFHNSKMQNKKPETENIKIYFAPQDKPLQNALLPLIQKSKEYIYVPAFIITEKQIVQELINAHNRGVDVKIITDALNASNKYSRHKDLRQAGIPVKTENYAGKMHSKSMIIDGKYLVLGSMNFSKNGTSRNDENIVVINNPDAAAFYKTFFLYQWNKIDNKWLKYNARAEGKDSIGSCFDGIDNNYDGFIDSDDPACK